RAPRARPVAPRRGGGAPRRPSPARRPHRSPLGRAAIAIYRRPAAALRAGRRPPRRLRGPSSRPPHCARRPLLARPPPGSRAEHASGRGLVPQAHAATPPTPYDWRPLVGRLLGAAKGPRARALLHAARHASREQAAAGRDWRGVVDGVRPHTAALWGAMPPAE